MKRRKKSKLSLMLIALILVASVGYALLSQTLKINGISIIKNAKWDIHFENATPTSSSNVEPTVVPVANPEDKVTEISYEVTLNKPGDVYEFTVDAVNAGTVDGMVNLVTSTMQEENEELVDISYSNLPTYLSYSATYDDGFDILKNHLLKAGESETYKIRVEFKKDIEASELPEANKTIEFKFQVNYVQADNNAVDPQTYNSCTYNGELVQGAEYINGQYTYRYMQENNGTTWNNISDDGWGVVLTDKNTTDPVNSKLCSSINNKPLVSMKNMFSSSKTSNIDTSSFDTRGVKNASNMFENCTNLTTLDLSTFDLSKLDSSINSTENMLMGMDKLESLKTPKKLFESNSLVIKLPKRLVDGSDNIYTQINSQTLTNIEITKAKVAVFDTGSVVNEKIRMLIPSGGDITKKSPGRKNSNFKKNSNTKIAKSFLRKENLPDGFEIDDNNTVSSSDSEYPIYIWYSEEEQTINYYTKASKIYFNTDASYMFSGLNDLEDIGEMADVDSSMTENISHMFEYCTNLKTLDMSNWDFSSIVYQEPTQEYMEGGSQLIGTGDSLTTEYMLYGNDSLKTIITPKKLFGDEDVSITLPNRFKDSNNNSYEKINNNTPKNTTLTSLMGTVYLNANGGNVYSDVIRVYYGEKIGDLPIPIRDEYAFVGWYTDIEQGTQVTEDTILENDMEIYARWRDLEYYEITFNKNNNNATGIMENQQLIETYSQKISKNTYSLEGYAFIGWNTKADGSGTSYLDESYITITENITLYAQWQKTYVLTFNKNDASATGETYSIEKIAGENITLTDEMFRKYKKNNQIIGYYNTKDDYSGISYYPNQSITLSTDITLYGHWIIPPITETIYWALQSNYGGGRSNDTLVLSDKKVTGKEQGSFPGDEIFTRASPWQRGGIIQDSYDNPCINVNKVKIEGIVAPLSTAYWFYGVGINSNNFYDWNTKMDLDNLYTSRVVNMRYMFFWSDLVQAVDFSKFDTSNVTDMSYMFSEAGTTWSRYNLNLTTFNTSKVTNMEYMFSGIAGNSVNLTINNFDTSNVTNMREMFSNADYSSGLDISNWNTSNVTDMSNMFYSSTFVSSNWKVKIPQTNGNNINNDNYHMYGSTTSTYASPPLTSISTKAQFTIATN